jgi:hypothetical protein
VKVKRKKSKKVNTQKGGPGQYNTIRVDMNSEHQRTRGFQFAGRVYDTIEDKSPGPMYAPNMVFALKRNPGAHLDTKTE